MANAPLMNGTPARGVVLTLYIGMFDSGWGQPGSWFGGSPMTWTVASDSLDINALLALAQTLQFPSMLPPLHGATPEPYFK